MIYEEILQKIEGKELSIRQEREFRKLNENSSQAALDKFCRSFKALRRRDTYRTGMKVTVSVKELYESNIVTEEVYIDTENNDNGEIGYWDLYNDKYGLVCMDGETCEIISIDENSITLKNEDGENATKFVLTFEEADICCIKEIEEFSL